MISLKTEILLPDRFLAVTNIFIPILKSIIQIFRLTIFPSIYHQVNRICGLYLRLLTTWLKGLWLKKKKKFRINLIKLKFHSFKWLPYFQVFLFSDFQSKKSKTAISYWDDCFIHISSLNNFFKKVDGCLQKVIIIHSHRLTIKFFQYQHQ